MGEDYETGPKIMDRGSMGRCVWVCTAEGKKMGEREEYLLRKKGQGRNDPRDGLYPVDRRNPNERRMIEFLFLILYPKKPKRLNIIMANTIVGV